MTDATAPRAGLMQSAWANPILLLVVTTLIWAAHSIVGRLAVGLIGPMTLTCLRWAVALIPILIAARHSLRQDWPALRARWVYLAVMGAAGYTVFVALFYVAAHHTSALNLSIIQGAIPALVLIGARVFLGVRFGAWQALGALVTMLGVVVIAAQGDLAKLMALAFNSGDLLMILASALYAGVQRYTKINGPVLAIYAAPRPLPPNAPSDTVVRARMDSVALAGLLPQIIAFQRGVPQARVVRLAHATHYVFRSNEPDVLRELYAFMDALPSTR